jgi:hypothetical protein
MMRARIVSTDTTSGASEPASPPEPKSVFVVSKNRWRGTGLRGPRRVVATVRVTR